MFRVACSVRVAARIAGGVVNEYPVVDLQWQKNFSNPSAAAGAASGPAEFT